MGFCQKLRKSKGYPTVSFAFPMACDKVSACEGCWGEAAAVSRQQPPQEGKTVGANTTANTEKCKKCRKYETGQQMRRCLTQRKHHTLIPGSPIMANNITRLEKQFIDNPGWCFCKVPLLGQMQSFPTDPKPSPKPALGYTAHLKEHSLQESYFRCTQCDWDHTLPCSLSLLENKNFALNYNLVFSEHPKSRV